MSSSVALEVSFFGAFRKFSLPSPLSVVLPHGSTVVQLKSTLREILTDSQAVALMEDSAVADEYSVLQGDHVFQGNARVALLPPVCGG